MPWARGGRRRSGAAAGSTPGRHRGCGTARPRTAGGPGDRGPRPDLEPGIPGRVSERGRGCGAVGATEPAAGKLWRMADTSSAELPLPPVEAVRPGLWSIPVPIPNNPLRYVLVYAFETDRGPYLIDAGWNTDDAYQTLVAGLDQAGFAIDDVAGRAGDPHPPRPLRPGRTDPGGVGGVGRPAPRRRPPDPVPLRGARRAARAHGRHAAPGRRPAGGRDRPAAGVHAGPRLRVGGHARHPDGGRRQAGGARAGTSPPSGRPATRRATCASTRPAIA